MKRFSLVRALGVSALVVAVTSLPSRAGAATITLDTGFQGVTVGYFFTGIVDPSTNFDGRAEGVVGSVLMSNGSGIGSGLDAPSVFEAYCVDLEGSVFDAGTSTQTVPVTVDASVAQMSAWTNPTPFPTTPPATRADAGAQAAYLYNTFASTVTSNADRTALAMAIWNTLYDTDNSVSDGAGAFYVWDDPNNNNIVSTANGYLAALGPADNAVWLQLSTSVDNVQDFMASTQSVPEPSSMLLLAMGLVGVGAASRRRSRAVR